MIELYSKESQVVEGLMKEMKLHLSLKEAKIEQLKKEIKSKEQNCLQHPPDDTTNHVRNSSLSSYGVV